MFIHRIAPPVVICAKALSLSTVPDTHIYIYILYTRSLCVCVCACVRVCGHVYVVYEDTNLYNDMGMT